MRAQGSRHNLLALIALLVLAAGLPGEAWAQCQLVTGPTRLTCPDCNQRINPPQSFNASPGWLGLFNSGGDRLLAPMTWGTITYSLANPALPSEINVYDLRYPGPPGPPPRDGQSYGNGYGISPDGQRALYSLHIPAAETVVSVPSGNGWSAMGDTGIFDANAGLVVQINGGRYIAYGLDSSGHFFAVDITTLPGFNSVNPIPFEHPALFSSSAQSMAMAEGNGKQFLYGHDGAGVTVIDVSNPGPAGSITRSFSAKSFPLSAFGLPGQSLMSVSAAVDPATGKLYVLGSFWNARVQYFSLVLYDPATSQATLVGTYTTPSNSGYTSEAGVNVGTLAVNPNTGDVWAFMWFGGSAFGTNRLYATSAKTFGSPIGLWADVSGTAGSLGGTTILFKNRTDAYAYFWDGVTPWAIQLNCQVGRTPATGRLSVSNVSGGSPVPVSSGDTVFVGDTLSVTPTVTPSNAVQGVTGWNLDHDYHASAEAASIGLMQLRNPDACLSGCASPGVPYPTYFDPPTLILVGPCDPQKLGNPATGGGCWNSVGPSPGNGDFPSSQPASGTMATLPIAFEAENALNTTTVPLATFNIVWKVPAVKIQSLSALLNNGSATFADGSEGHPLPTAYKWYFGASNAAPSRETLNQDTTGPGCNGGASCTHAFAAGKGTYNAWLVASYKNGYSSPDCMNPCGGAAGSFRVSVTDFEAAFTAPSSGITNTNLSITNNSRIGGGVTGIGYAYTLCDASSGPCLDPANYQPITGMGAPGTTGTVPAPGTGGTWWLRIRASYTSGSAQTAQWQPTVSGLSDTTAWPISVSSPPPVSVPTLGFDYCISGGCPNPYTGTVGTPITVILTQGGAQVTGTFAWSVSGAGASPATGSGSSFTFTPNSTGTAIVSVTGYSPAPSPIGFTIDAAPPILSVSVSSSSNSPTAGTAVTITASASGGTGTYPTYDWSITDGTTPFSSGGFSTISHTFTSSGSYTVTGTVHDSAGTTASGNTVINVQAPAAAASALRFYTLSPCRLFDTRNESGADAASPSLVASASRMFDTTGRCSVPSGAKSLSVNVTVTGATAQGFLTLYPGDGTLPLASTISFKVGETRANNALIRLATDGSAKIGVLNGSAGTVDFILDVNGYFQ